MMKSRVIWAVAILVTATLAAAQALKSAQPGLAKGEMHMTPRETIQAYFDHLARKDGWESFLADDMLFTSLTSPSKQVQGKEAYLQATKRFYSMIVAVELRDLIIEGEKACALTRYELQPPNAGPIFRSDVAEVFSVRNGRIESFVIYFDSAPFPK